MPSDFLKGLLAASSSQGAGPFGEVATNIAQQKIENENRKQVPFVGSPYLERPWDVGTIQDMLSKLTPIEQKTNISEDLTDTEEISNILSNEPIKSTSKKLVKQSQPSEVKQEITDKSTQELKPKTDSEMKALLAQYQAKVNEANLGRGLNKALSTAYGYLGFSPDEEGYKEQMKQAGMPVEMLEKQREADAALIKRQKEAEYNDPSSKRSQVTRDMAKQYLSIAGLSNMADKINDTMSAEQIDTMTKGMFNEAVTAKMHKDQMIEAARIRAENKSSGADLKKQAIDDRRAESLKKDLDPNQARGGNLALNQKRVDAAERLEALVTDTNGMMINLTPQQMNELASGLDAMISANPSIAGREHLTPESKSKWVAEKLQWLTDSPQGADQMAFIRNMSDTVAREKSIAQRQVQKAQKQRLSAHTSLKKDNPELYNEILSSYGLNENNEDNENEVERKDPKSGKIAIFDSNTKKFLRWKGE